MSKVSTVWAAEESLEMGSLKKIVHIIGDGVVHMDTLCGHVDRTDYTWRGGGKVTCLSCLHVWKYVKDNNLP